LTDGEIRRIPDIAYNMFKKNYQSPNAHEGFTEIKEIQFSPDLENDNQKQYFLKKIM